MFFCKPIHGFCCDFSRDSHGKVGVPKLHSDVHPCIRNDELQHD